VSKKIIKYLGGGLAIQFLPMIVSAQAAISNFTIYSITDILKALQDWFSGILATLGVIIMLYAAFLYMTAGGDEEKVGKAKKTLLYGLVGVGIAILAYASFRLFKALFSESRTKSTPYLF